MGDYIAFKLLNPIAAENMVKGIREQINKLEVFPASYELDDDSILAELGIHKTYYKEYKIFYTIDDNVKKIFIVRILHIRIT